MKISLLCPSRERINKTLTLLSSLILTTNRTDNIELCLGVDCDDPFLDQYKKISSNIPFISLIISDPIHHIGLSGIWNNMYNQAEGDILAMVGDDMIFKTLNWDEIIINKFINGPDDKIQLVHCNDGMRGPGNKYVQAEPLAVNSFIHRRYTDIIGRYVQDHDNYIFQDTWLNEVFKRLNRKVYMHDVLIKHLHFSESSTNNMDKVSKKLETHREGIWNDTDLWSNTFIPLIKDEVIRLKPYMNNDS